MDELDLLKKNWNRDDGYRQVSETEIYGMLHKKSSSIVKWILIISILEFLFWAALGLFGGKQEARLGSDHNVLAFCIKVMEYLPYAVTFVFIYLFYMNFRRISATASVHTLMRDIIKTRVTVNYYVWCNIAMVVIILILGFRQDFIINPEIRDLKAQMQTNGTVQALVIGFLVLSTLLIVGVVWLFYKLIYGLLLRRLMGNYKELEKIEL